jgi:putative N6-adenine-specific DNA methylase
MERVGRGGLKLEAAIEKFGLGERIRGASCIDVGASTGGFTEAMLQHGAAHVTAADVGHGQLHPSLRDDSRVTNLEGVHWKTLPLSVAAGPFDFFSVDVSFVAARTMLRGLAFRLRDGAEGVVLVKPQFELPDGDTANPQRRELALERVREKGESLGFELVAHADSPVAGREGTVEILAHLRFRGRSQSMPKPGEKRETAHKGPSQKAPSKRIDEWRCFAVAAPGLELAVSKELAPIAKSAVIVKGGVEFSGSLEQIYRANLWLRSATRVLVRVGDLEAREFARLRRGVAKLPWDHFLDGRAPLEFSVSQTRSRLYHTGAVEENLALALKSHTGPASDDAGEPIGIYARGEQDRWTLSIDASGELLHKRGWRDEATAAPMRETLAAGLLMLCEWDAKTPLVDPMCGSGTIAIEAAAIAANLAPGAARPFAFQRWASFDSALWQRLLDEANAARTTPPAPILASDRDDEAVEATRKNLARAGLDAFVTVEKRELGALAPPAGSGLVLVNPPYGKRLGDPRSVARLYDELGRVLHRRFAGWRAGVLVADRRLEPKLGTRPTRATPLQNGGLRVRLVEIAL